MDVVLVIIVAALVALVLVIIVRGQRASRPALKQKQAEARVTAEKGEAQHEESLRRRAGVRAAHTERDPRMGSDTEE